MQRVSDWLYSLWHAINISTHIRYGDSGDFHDDCLKRCLCDTQTRELAIAKKEIEAFSLQ